MQILIIFGIGHTPELASLEVLQILNIFGIGHIPEYASLEVLQILSITIYFLLSSRKYSDIYTLFFTRYRARRCRAFNSYINPCARVRFDFFHNFN
ncbi:MAG: hypothetical protein ACE5KT_11545 [Methanosarcinales archaeon]